MTWRDTKIVARTDWSDDLWTLRLDARCDFEPGQWVNLGLDVDGELVKRPYSLASAPGAPAEVYLVEVEGGALTPRLHTLSIGDVLRIDDSAQGFFTTAYVPDAEVLWLMATGTGLGPFMSMLRSGQLWSRFPRVVVVHGARRVADLGYRDELERLTESRPLAYVPMVTRERHEETLHGRITENIERGWLEKAAGVQISPETAHVMLCGNPDMIGDAMSLLAERGLRRHRTRKPGHITIEKYW